MQKEVQINHLTPDVARWENEGGAPSQPKSDKAISWRTGNQPNDRRWYLRDRSCSRLHMGAPVVKKNVAYVAVIFLGLATHAIAGVAEKQWSVSFPDHTAIPESFGVPIRERFEASENMRLPEVPMPVPAPGRDMAPSPVETKE